MVPGRQVASPPFCRRLDEASVGEEDTDERRQAEPIALYDREGLGPAREAGEGADEGVRGVPSGGDRIPGGPRREQRARLVPAAQGRIGAAAQGATRGALRGARATFPRARDT